MAQRVMVVTDSTSSLPPGFARELGITVVPLTVTLDSRTGTEGEDILPADVTRALAEKRTVTTSRPSPAQFAEVYRRLLKSGARQVISIHLSSELSGTWDSARLAAQEFDYGVVRVVDSRSTAMALGFAVLDAARAAAGGARAGEVADVAVATADRARTLVYVDTLEYLRRGGRIGAAASLVGTALAMKPLLHVRDGRILPLEKVRTTSKALSRLVALSVAEAGDGPVDLAVHHLAAAERAEELAGRLRAQIPNVQSLYVSEIGAVVGAHVGPGVIGVVVVARRA
jgi:DegV family protein with EDD domain